MVVYMTYQGVTYTPPVIVTIHLTSITTSHSREKDLETLLLDSISTARNYNQRVKTNIEKTQLVDQQIKRTRKSDKRDFEKQKLRFQRGCLLKRMIGDRFIKV